MLVDEYEPQEIFDQLSQAIETYRAPLNRNNCADYMFQAADGMNDQFERKQAAELLGSLDHCEQQLRKYYNSGRLHLIIEGVIHPTAVGCDIYIHSEDKQYFRLYHRIGNSLRPRTGLYSEYMAWRWQLDKAGVTVIETSGQEALVMALGSFYRNAQKSEHTTLRRYTKQRIVIPVLDSQVELLMGIEGLGEARAKALVKQLGSAWAVLSADPEVLASVKISEKRLGSSIAQQILKAIGRK